MTAVVVGCAALAAALATSPSARLRATVSASASSTRDGGWIRRARWLWALLAGGGAAVVVGGPVGVVAGLAVAAAIWVVAGRVEPAAVRRRREEVRRDLPHVVALLAAALRSGAAPSAAVGLVCNALPGTAAERLRPVAHRLELGADPAAVWQEVARDEILGGLGRALARSHRSGAPVVGEVERFGLDLARQARAEVEDRARAVGVRAAVPLGTCFLPAFILLGIVPVVAGLIGELGLT